MGVALTPRHITELFCELVDLKPTDVIFDPCCGKSDMTRESKPFIGATDNNNGFTEFVSNTKATP